MYSRKFLIRGSLTSIVLAGTMILAGDDTETSVTAEEAAVQHAECGFFGANRDRFVSNALKNAPASSHPLSAITGQVSAMRTGAGGSRPSFAAGEAPKPGSIDAYIWADFQARGITPAGRTNDYEFIRRVTLDLTGRIPKPDRVLEFAADTAAGKRARLVDELLARPEWVDKWTMYFGDLYKNTVNRPSSGVRRFNEGRNAFYQWIQDSLSENKPYNQMASELIAAEGPNSYEDGRLNFLLGYIVSGGPQQDVTDSWTSAVADTFLGISHVNCLLCHNGRGHLDQLSLWGKNTTRYQVWQLASFLSHTRQARTVVDSSNNNIYYWSLLDNTRGFTTDYTLNTTTGNRPARQSPQQGCRSGQPCYYVQPVYIFNGNTPQAGENYRVALAREVTGDFQFARATVNYMWDQFFGRGLVDPVNTFDPARLDPDNPPPDPWTLQPSNARLLNALAGKFIENGYDLKWLMREIVSSEAYQLSSRYNGRWNAEWEPYFARKFVRRLWAEEVHDAIVDASGVLPKYNVPGFTSLGFPTIGYAMRAPDTVGVPTAAISAFLDAFIRGNRDDNERKADGSVQQALNLMNDTFVTSRLAVTGGNASPLLAANINRPDDELIGTLFLNILSRNPTEDEREKAKAALASGNRTQAVQDLVWSLYNKVDFIFNY